MAAVVVGDRRRRRRHLCAVYGKGQCRVSYRELSGDPVRQRRTVEAGRPAEGAKLGYLVRRQVLDLRTPRRFYGPSPCPFASRLLALAVDGQCPGDRR